MKFLSGNALVSELSAALQGQPFDAAVAYWGKGAVELLGLGSWARGSRIFCDAFSGACNPSTLRQLFDLGVEIWDCPGLHAKVYLTDQVLFSGSANASANGLGREDDELKLGLEAGLLTHDPALIGKAEEWLHGIIGRSSRLKPDQLAKIEEAWRARRNQRPMPTKLRALEDVLLGQSEVLSDRRIFLCVFTEVEPPKERWDVYHKQGYNEPALEEDGQVPFFWDAHKWDVRSGDLILSYHHTGGRLKYDAMSIVRDVLDGGAVVPVIPVKKPLGLRLDPPQANRIGMRISTLIASGEIDVPTPQLVPLATLAELLRTPGIKGATDRPVAPD
ncbi:hypothetical protein [Novosphingobium sp.]|uniref:hypothetical protein n=1 Tax=Novosphingobium sp. TaxID=1874826 RepID=UPI001D424B38|nr:hypothetical protein [Novosphingobium sp.]MBX9664425.1 hypothetical protein [Novosphingobium sp.]